MSIRQTNDYNLPVRSMKRVVSTSLVGLSMLTSTLANSQETRWWFDIEVIAFKRNIAPSDVLEQFPQQLNQIDQLSSFRLLEQHLYPDLNAIFAGLPVCFEPVKQQVDLQPVEYELDTSTMTLDFAPQGSEQHSSAPPLVAELESSPFAVADTVNSSVAPAPPINSSTSSTHVELWAQTLTLDPVVIPENPLCRMPDERWTPEFVPRVPREIDGRAPAMTSTAHLLPSASFELKDLAKDIERQRGLSMLVHLAWRQEVKFGAQNARAMRLFAGTNFARQFNMEGNRQQPSPIVQQSESIVNDRDTVSQFSQPEASTRVVEPISTSLIDKILLALNSDQPISEFELEDATSQMSESDNKQQAQTPEQLWELDGNLTIFLRYIQRTPYLHIDGDFDFRAPVFDRPAHERNIMAAEQVITQPTQPDRLQSYPFSQLRRVISKQVHYFDHPMFGLIVQIRRYDLPQSFANESQ